MYKWIVNYFRALLGAKPKVGDIVLLYGLDTQGAPQQFKGEIVEIRKLETWTRIELKNVSKLAGNVWIEQKNEIYGDYESCFLLP